MNFSFTFGTPVVPLVGPNNTVKSSFSGSFTDNGPTPDGVVTVTALPPGVPVDGDGTTEMQVTTVSGPMTNIGMDLGPTFSWSGAPGSSGGLTGYNQGPAPGPNGTWTGLQIDLTFSLSPWDIVTTWDIVTMNGRSEINPVPIPGAVWMLGSGLLGVAGIRRKYNR